MINSFPESLKHRSFFFIVFFALATVAAIGARTWSAHATKTTETPAAALSTVPAVGQGKRDHNMQVELVTVGRHGFEPAEITRPKGTFLLAVDNRSGLKEIDLQISRESGQREREMKVHRRKPDWRGLIDLPPGRYKLTESGNPDWACRITITAQ